MFTFLNNVSTRMKRKKFKEKKSESNAHAYVWCDESNV